MNQLKTAFHQQYPTSYFLDTDLPELTSFLMAREWILPGEKLLGVEKPGEGNMNFVLRIKTTERSFILKQARPWVEKYPQIAAPIERNQVEATYFNKISEIPALSAYSPKLLASSPLHFLMMLGDLGEGVDYLPLYQAGPEIADIDLKETVAYLAALHQVSGKGYPENQAMRVLNHEHIFHFPFLEDNGLDLDAILVGLGKESWGYRQNEVLKEKISRLGKIYLSNGPILVHGDFYPGSWLKTSTGLKVIDPEFSFPGIPEFDLGVLVAHMILSQQDRSTISRILGYYVSSVQVDEELLSGFAGTEILRRVLGVAQLPLAADLSERIAMMRLAEKWVMTGQLT
ncbi:MAG: phosphotransferase [Bacteroidota bacterium]